MATLAELCAARTDLDDAAVGHLLSLTASWSLLADLAFSDLLLVAPEAPGRLVVLAQVRPQNRATLIGEDLVGASVAQSDWAGVAQALAGARAVGPATPAPVEGPVELWAVPVRVAGQVVAALVRVLGPLLGPASAYQAVYLSLFDRLCDMVAAAEFPFREAGVAGPGLPRVGDGIVLLDGAGRVEFATPNATSALHRLGVAGASEGKRLEDLGLRLRGAERALAYGLPSLEEVDAGHDVAILCQAVPLLARGAVTGVVVLTRDVSDLRLLNRLVMNKEAAVREVHHRVKNNLQTISSLLRLQARRSADAEARSALLEAERRVRSIAVVHEVLSREPGEEVVFDEIVRSLVLLVEDTVLALHPVEIVVNGELGVLPADVATPLAVALAELLTNAVEHAFIEFGGPANDEVGVVTLDLERVGGDAVAVVRDNGRGLGEGFSLEDPTSLGLSIVRDLIRSQLRGTIEMETVSYASGGGARARVVVPVARD
ncbi:MAG TPA: sensor histidine kinase [Acidimicrobiales bacterium]|nr:sensor histidine kinase [Acidimicrobiales bacterium]